MDLKQFFLQQKQAVYEGTREVLARIPPGDLAWRPAEGMLTLGEIARHCWMSEQGMRRLALADDWSYFDRRIPLGLEGILGDVTTLDAELEKLREVHEATLREVGEFPLDRWDEERINEAFGMKRRVSVLLFGINEHLIHHRAQVALSVRTRTGARASHYKL